MEILGTVIGITIKSLIFIVGMFLAAAYLTLVERKFAGHVQQRPGPLHVGYHGLLQPIADALKVLTKEDLVPDSADKFLFYLASLLAFVPSIMILAVVPFGEPIEIFGFTIYPYISDVNVGLLLALAFGSISLYGVIFAGWASNSKYPMIGGLRKAAVLIGYEVALGFAIAGPIMQAGTFSLKGIVEAQQGLWFIIPNILAFVVIIFAVLAETGRTPFDVQEAEAELVGGYVTEYSAMKFGLFPLAEWYIATFVLSAITVILFFGGWHPFPFLGWLPIPGIVWFFIKLFAVFMFFLWVHWTLPRYRVDQITELAWKVMLPLALANIFIVAIWIMIFG